MTLSRYLVGVAMAVELVAPAPAAATNPAPVVDYPLDDILQAFATPCSGGWYRADRSISFHRAHVSTNSLRQTADFATSMRRANPLTNCWRDGRAAILKTYRIRRMTSSAMSGIAD